LHKAFAIAETEDRKMSNQEDGSRHYAHSDLPVVTKQIDAKLSDSERALLQLVYAEVCTTWRALVDVRFKLLALVPFASVAVLVVILPDTGSTERLKGLAGALIAVIGFLVTLGLLFYELRNSQLHNDLISRGRRIEAELGIQTGIFRGRTKPQYPFVNHSTAIFIIYGAALAGWAVALLAV
jgi:hypothetical protein